ncbi:MAG: tetratricopeptide repeat protein [Pyrinomonadaceae bacterium]
MSNWLRPLMLMFYNPARGMIEVRDRAPLALAAVLAMGAQAAYLLFTQWNYLRGSFALSAVVAFTSIIFQSAGMILLIGLIFVPVCILVVNLFERRGSFGIVLRQEYSSFASTIFYSWATANLIGLPLTLLANASGLRAVIERGFVSMLEEQKRQLGTDILPHVNPQTLTPFLFFVGVFTMLILLAFGLYSVLAVKQVFRLSVLRSSVVATAGGVAMIVGMQALPIVSSFLASPFLLILTFLVLRGYVGELTRSHKARASFKRNLEAATLNPADASAHYNLGLIHAQRKELSQARERFERAIEIDAEEINSHYELGRIARTQDRLGDAIKSFEQVVSRDMTHAQHEIWREIGATYVAAGQYEDAVDALERFLDHRPSDPEALYLRGRALAGLGRQPEAVESMRACIEAVQDRAGIQISHGEALAQRSSTVSTFTRLRQKGKR